MIAEGSVAIVTGASSGLGRATATRLAKAGAHVVMFDLKVADDVADLGADATFVLGDVTDSEAVGTAIDVAQAVGPLRIVVNCAGGSRPHKTVNRHGEAFPLEDFTRDTMLNLVGTFNVIRLCAAAISDSDEPEDGERGVIINTASIAAFDGQAGQAAYSAAKAGIVGMTLPIARDLAAFKIRVVTIAPGIFDTPILQVLPQKARDSIAASVPHPARLGAPSEFADLVHHVVSNPMINGETIRLDGAMRLAPQ